MHVSIARRGMVIADGTVYTNVLSDVRVLKVAGGAVYGMTLHRQVLPPPCLSTDLL